MCVKIVCCLHHYTNIGAPPAPINLTAVTPLLNGGDTTLSTVNLTWFQENSCYVAVYYVEVTATNISIIHTNMTTLLQYITLKLFQNEVVYFFRVRGADSINRLGEWSDYLTHNTSKSIYYQEYIK